MILVPWAALVLAAGAAVSQPSAPPREILVDVRVHGNHTTPDAEVLRLAGIAIGDPLPPDAVARVTARLRASGRFEGVEVRKRYRSLSDASAVALVILVDDKPPPGVGPPLPGPIEALRRRLMFLPVLTYTDGYGLTYGGRIAFADAFGARSRVGVPLTWGAWKRAAVEGEKRFDSGPVSRIEGGAAVGRRENPFYRLDDRRGELWLRAERAIGPRLRAGGRVGWSDVSFGPDTAEAPIDLDERFLASALDLTLDTRTDPGFPRDAVYVRGIWEVLRFDGGRTVHRHTIDGRGFIGIVGQSVLSLRALYGRASAPLPPYEQWLLGGASSVRGLRAGSSVGDNLFAASAEVRVPLTSPLNVGKAGVVVFVDAGTAYRRGARLADQRLQRGAGAGLFFVATVFQLNLDVARGSGGDTRLHVGAGFSF